MPSAQMLGAATRNERATVSWRARSRARVQRPRELVPKRYTPEFRNRCTREVFIEKIAHYSCILMFNIIINEESVSRARERRKGRL